MQFNPRPYQLLIIDFIQRNKRCAIWAGMGLGKTSSTLAALQILNLVEDAFPVLVIAPLRVVQSTWPEEILKWELDLSFSDLTKDKSISEVNAINYEQLPNLIKRFGTKWPFKTVIADESTKLKGFRLRQGAARAKALAKVAHTLVDRMVLLTGTPAANGLLDLWGQMWFIDKGERLGKTYTAFTDKWFTESYNGWTVTPKAHAQEEIQELLSDICITISAEDWFDLKAPIVNTIQVDLPVKVQKLYSQLERDMYIELENETVDAVNAGSAQVKCRQIANGFIYKEDASFEVLHDEKLKALESVIEEANGMPILVAYHFKADAERLVKRFPKGLVIDSDPKTIKRWNAGKIPLLFVNPKSAGHGLNLQDGSNILVFYSYDWNLEEHLQVIERIGPVRQLQAGHNRPVFIYYLTAKDTIDEQVLERLQTKRSIQEVLLDAMNRYKGAKNGRLD